jgi:hypothetical protein
MAQDGDISNAIQPYSSTGSNLKTRTQNLGQIVASLSSSSSNIISALGDIASAITQKLIGGVVGTSTNRLLRVKTVSSGSSAGSVQNTGITCDNSDNLTAVGSVAVVSGGAFRTATSNSNTALLQAYDVDGAAYTTFGTLTAGNTPTFDLATATTKGGAAIAVVTQVFFWSWYFPNATAKNYMMIVNSPVAATINSITTICESGTATLTGKINTTALGGTANSVSTSEQTQTHSSSNSLAVGDDFQLTPSSISSLVGMTVTVKITVTLAAS